MASEVVLKESGRISDIQGLVYRMVDGQLIPVSVGESVFAGQILVLEAGAKIKFIKADGEEAEIVAAESQTTEVEITGDVENPSEELDDATLSEIEQIQQAVAEGDLSNVGATAAGGSSSSEGGATVTSVERNDQQTIAGAGFDTNAATITTSNGNTFTPPQPVTSILIDTTAPEASFDDLLTNTLTPTLTGSVDDPNATISATINGQPIAVTNNGDGSFSIADAFTLIEGSNQITITLVDQSGNQTVLNATITADVTLPQGTIDSIVTDDTTPAITGTVDDPEALILVSIDGQIFEATNNGDGSWTLADDVVAELAEQQHDVTVTFFDLAGNTNNAQGTVTVEINEAPEIQIQSINLSENNVFVGQAVATFEATDPDGDSLTLELVNNDNGFFAISGNQIVLTQAGVDAIQNDELALTSIDYSLSATDGEFTTLANGDSLIARGDNSAVVSVQVDGDITELGGTVQYTAVLSQATESEMTVTLASGVSITIAAGQIFGNAQRVIDADEDVYIDAETLTDTILSVSGGSFDSIVIDSTPVTINVADTINETTLALSASESVSEAGGQITYTATLSNPAQTQVTVTLASGQIITIEAEQTQGQVVVDFAASDDVYAESDTITDSISDVTGGNFERLSFALDPVSTGITDTIDVTRLTLSADTTINEGQEIEYTAVLSNPAASDMTINLTNGETIVINAGQTEGSVLVSIENTATLDATTIINQIDANSVIGGGFEQLDISTESVTTQVSDVVETTQLTLTADSQVNEGSNINYTVSTTSPTATDLTVQLTNGLTITILAGQSSASAAFVTQDSVYQDARVFNVAIDAGSVTGGNFEDLQVDTTSVVTNVADVISDVTLTFSADSEVTAGDLISYQVSLSEPAATDLSIPLSNGQTIIVLAGQSSGFVEVTAPSEQSSLSVSIDEANISGGNFENLVLGNSSVTTDIASIAEEVTLSLSGDLNATEGGSINYTASLTAPAETAMTITLSNGAEISIAAGQSSGSVSVAVSDDVYNGADDVVTTLSLDNVTGGNFENLVLGTNSVTTTVSDVATDVTLNLTGSTTAAEAGSITYTASLTAPAETAMTITLSNGAEISIAAGQSSGSVSVAVSDDVYNGADDVVTTLSLDNVSGGNFENLVLGTNSVTTTVSDVATDVTLNLTGSTTAAEAGSITYTASLTAPAETAMTITLSNGAEISIAAGQSSGSVSVAVGDDVYNGADDVVTTLSLDNVSGGNFENLVLGTNSVTTEISDVATDVTLNLTGSSTAAEAGSITYTASLTAPAETAMSITLSNGAEISIAAGQSSGSVSVAVGDDVYVGADSITTTLSLDNVTGGNFENLVLGTNSVTTEISDVATDVTLNLTGSTTAAEAGSITYTASLTAPAETAMTITLSNGAEISIAAGQSSGSVSVAVGDDVYVGADSITTTLSLDNVSGGNFENLVLGTNSVTTEISDVATDVTLNLTGSTTAAEAGSITYSASLTAPAETAMTITLSNGAEISIAAGQSSGSVSVAVSDDVYNGADDVVTTLSLDNVSGGNFENLVLGTNSVTTAVSDAVSDVTLNLTGSTTAAEAGSITYTASLTAPAQTAMTITLSNGAEISIAAGQSSGSVSVAVGDDVYVGADSITTTLSLDNVSGGNFENLILGTSSVTTTVSDTVSDVTLNLTGSTTAAEAGSITYTASLTAPAETAMTITLSNGAEISIAAGQSSGSVSVAVSDDVYNGADDVVTTLSLDNVSGGNFENLILGTNSVTTEISDVATDVTLNLTGSSTALEAGSITYTASLTAPAETAMTITLSNGAEISIAAGQSSGSISVAVSDDVYNGADDVVTTLSLDNVSGGNFENLVLGTNSVTTEISDVATDVSLNLTGSSTAAEAGSITYTASLTAPAETAMTITLRNEAVITIAAGQSSGSVSVAVGDDVYVGADSITTTLSLDNVSGGNFENLVLGTNSVTTEISDVATDVTLNLTGSTTAAEAGSITYTASLTAPAETAMTITLSNGAEISIAAGQSSGSVSVSVSDDVYNGADDVVTTLSLDNVSGGNFENLVLGTNSVTTEISDVATDVTLNLTGSTTAAEAGSITYTASLTAPAETAMTITLSNGSEISIAAGQSSGSVSVAVGDDVYNGAGDVVTTLSLDNVSGGNFENLVLGTNSVTTTVSDVATNVTLNLTGSSTALEAGSITYTASLTAPAETAMTITLSNGAEISIAAGQSSGSVSVAVGDDVYVGADSITTTLSLDNVSGGNFENLVLGTSSVTTTVSDTVSDVTLNLTGSTTAAEAGSITYTARLTAPAETAMTITLSNGAEISIAAGQSSGSVSVAVSDDVYNGADDVVTTLSLDNVSGGNFENLILGTSSVTTTVSDVATDVTLNLTGSSTAAEAGSITYTASLTAPAETAMTITLSNGAEISIAAGQSSGSVSVAVGDDVYVGADPITTTLSLDNVTGGNFENLVLGTNSVTTEISDVATDVTLNLTGSATAAEAGSITYTASLTAPAETAMTITLSNGAEISIAAGQSSGSVSVAVSDDVYVGADSITTTLSLDNVSGGNFENLILGTNSVTTTVSDVATDVTLNLTGSTTAAEAGSITYTASLTAPAETAMAITLSNGAEISIAAGQSSGSVSVAVGDDVYVGADSITTSLSLDNVSGGNFENLVLGTSSVTTEISDVATDVTLNLTGSSTAVEAGSITYTASLTAPAETAMTITLSNEAVITIAAGQSSGSVSVAVGDDVYVGADSITTTLSLDNVSGGNFENLVLGTNSVTTEISDVATDVTLNLTGSTTAAEAGSITYTASLTAPAETAMTITLSNGAEISIAAGQSSGSVSVAVSDDVYVGVDSITTTLSLDNVSGGNFENLVLGTNSVTTEISDVATDVTLNLTGSTTAAEAGSITYTASLTAPAETAMTITLSNGAEISIAAGQSSGSVSVSVSNDVYNGADDVVTTLSLDNVSGGNFENLVLGTNSVTTEISDVATDVTLNLTGSTTAVEAGSITYTASLTAPAETAMTITLSNGAEISIAAGQSSGSVSVAVSDDVYNGADDVVTTLSLDNVSGGNFENLILGTNSVTTEISDVATDVTLNLTGSTTAAEAGSITYTASLTAPAETAMTITLSNGAEISIAAGQSSGSVSVAVSDDVYVGADSITTTLSLDNVTGGNFENLVLGTNSVTTEVSDTVSDVTLNLTGSTTAAEAGSITYTASLTAPAETAMTLTLSNGAEISIAAGQSSGSVSVAVGDDVYVGADSITTTLSLDNVSGGNFENLVLGTNSVTTEISDVATDVTLNLTGSSTAAEAGSITYTASLTAPAETAMTLTLSNGAEISIAAGQSSGSVSVAVGDDVYVGADSITTTLSLDNVSGGNFENLVLGTNSVTTEISDVATDVTLNLTGSSTAAEAGSITYTASLTAPAETAMTLTLSNGAEISIAAGQSSGSVSVAVGDDVYVGADSITTTLSLDNVSGGNFENLVLGTNSVTTEISDVATDVTLNLTGSSTAAEAGSITYTASLTAPAETAMTITLSNGAEISIAAGQSSGSVSVAVSDDVYNGADDVVTTLSLDNVSGGNFENLILGTSSVTTTVSDVATDVTLNLTGSTTAAEAGSITYTASLTSPAETAMTITLSNGAEISIAAGQSSGSVSVAVSDDVYVGADPITTTLSLDNVTGGNFENLVLGTNSVTTEISDVATDVTLNLTGSTTAAEAGSITYTASLTAPAETAMTITLSNGAEISIAAGKSSGSVSVSVSDDVYNGADDVVTTLSLDNVSGGNFENLILGTNSVTTTVSDVATDVTLNLTGSTTAAEAGSITYTASLTAPAETAMAITLSNGAEISIAAGQSSGSVSVAVGDDVYVGADSITTSLSLDNVSGGNFENLVLGTSSVTTEISDVATDVTLNLTGSSTAVEAGSITYTASLTAPAETAMTITLSNEAVITIAAGQSSGSVSVAVGDDVYVGADSITTTLSLDNVSGGNFENLVLGTNSVTTEISDVATDVTLNLTGSTTAAEAGSITYTASLTAPAETAMTITLSNGAEISIAAGQSSGSVSVAVSDDVYVGVDSITTTLSLDNVSGGNFENLVLGTNSVTTEISDVATDVTLNLTGSTTAAEAGSITYTASLTAPAETAMTITLSNGAEISIAAGQSSGSVSVSVSNDVYNGADDVVTTLSLDNVSGGNFENLVLGTNSVTTEISDVATDVTLNLTGSTTAVEAGSITYTASLTAPAETAMTITLSNGAEISIAAGQSSGSVSVAVSDDVYNGADDVVTTLSLDNVSGGNFENLILGTNSVTTEISDVATDVTLNLTGSTTAAEAGSITYTASLTAPAETAMTITLSNGAEISIAAGQSSGSVSVAVSDDVYVGADSITTTLSLDNVTGGNFENLVLGTNSVTTEVSDTVSDVTLNLTGSTTAAEAGSITYTASLTAPAETAMTLTLSNGAEISIAAGQSSGSVSVAVGDDVYVGADSITTTLSLDNVSGGNFENLVLGTNSVTTEVSDTVSDVTLNLTGSTTAAEAGSITYTASLTAPAETAMTITLSNGAEISIAAGKSSGSVSVSVSDDVYNGADDVVTTLSLDNVSGGNFENLVLGTNSVTTEVSDTVSDVTLNLTGSTTAAEAGSITYTASLTAPAETAMTITLSNGAEISIAAGQSSGSVSVAVSDDVYNGADDVVTTLSLDNVSGGNFENLILGTNSVATTVSDVASDVTLNLTGSSTALEAGSITYTASLTAPAETAMTITLSNGAEISIAAGQSSGSVSVAVGDDVYVGADSITTTLSLDNVSGGNFENLVLGTNSVTTTVSDVATNVTLNLTGSSTALEAGSITYTASLTAPAETAMTLTLSNGAEISIAAGQSSGSVSVAVGDDVYVGADSITTTLSLDNVSGGNFENLVLGTNSVTTEISDVATDVTLNLTGSSTAAEAGSITYTASLTAPAETAMTLTLSNGAEISIAAGQSSGSVSVAVGDDVYVGADSITTTLSLDNVSGGNFENLVLGTNSVTTEISDVATDVTLNLTGSSTAAEAGSITYTASLTAPAETAMTLTLSNGAEISIAAGQSSGSVSVAVGDDVYVGADSITTTLSLDNVSGGNFENLVLGTNSVTTEISDVATDVTLNLTGSSTAAEAGSITYTASLTAPAETAMTITLSNGAEISIAAGKSSGSVSVSVSDDVYNGADDVVTTLSLDNVSGGNFENLVLGTNSVTTEVSDTVSDVTLNLTGSTTAAEAGSITYTASLTAPAETAMTITLSNGAEISIAAGQSSGSVSVAVSDDVYNGADDVVTTLSLDNVSGGNFENLVLGTNSVTTEISDVATDVTLNLTGSSTALEAGSITYTASLTAPAEIAMTITLSNGAEISIAAGQSSGSVSVAVSDDVYNGADDVVTTLSLDNVSGGNFENLILGTSSVTTTVSDVATDVTLNLTGSSTALEAGSITYTASLTAPAETAMTITLSNGAEISIAAGQSSGSVSVAVSDDVYNGADDVVTTLSLDNVSGGNFENLVLGTNSVTTTVTDSIDVTDLTMEVDTSNLLQGSISVDFALSNAAKTDLVITLASGEQVTIKAGSTSANVELEVDGDSDTFTVGVTSTSGGDFESLQLPSSVQVNVNLVPSIEVSDQNGEASGHITVDEAGIGADASSNIATGTITISTTANLANVTIGGHSVSALELAGLALNPVTIELPNGDMTLTRYNLVTGELSYQYELTDAIDHGETDSSIENVVIQVTDVNELSTSTNLTIQTLDDKPSFTINQPDAINFETMDYNLIFAIDVSNSMNNALGDTTVLQATIDGITQLLETYEGMGNVKVKLVPFSTDATEYDWSSISQSITLLEGLGASGTTDYDDALAAIVGDYSTPQDASTKVYFISDGNPYGTSENQNNVNAITNYQQTWKNFVETNNIDVEVIGIGSSVQYQYLNMVGAPTEIIQNESGEYVAADNVVSVTTAIQLAEALLASIGGKSAGEIGTGQSAAGVIDYGADSEGSILSIEVDGATYTLDSEQVENGVLTIETANGATLMFDFSNGLYEYDVSLSAENNADEASASWSKSELDNNSSQWILTENFTITVRDGDGDTASGQLTLTSKFPVEVASVAPVLEEDNVEITEVDGTVASSQTRSQISGNVIDNDTITETTNPVVGIVSGVGVVSEGNIGSKITGSYGSIVIQANGKYVYTLNNANSDVNNLSQGESLTDTFTYLVKDANGNYESTTINIQINGVDDSLPDLSENAVYGFGGNDVILTYGDSWLVGSMGSYQDANDPDALGGLHTFNSAELADVGFERSTIFSNNTTVATGYTSYDTSKGATLVGGEGADYLIGGSGDDVLIGGTNGNGNSALVSNTYAGDVMTGGSGSDMFVWLAGDDYDGGFANAANNPSVTTDYIKDFELTERDQAGDVTQQGDSLNLGDLLEGENHDNLDSYLNFEVVDGDTIISVSKDGDFTGDSSDEDKTDMKIVLENTDLSSGTNGTDADIIRKLLEDNQLITNNNNNL
ncbi:immunoglobulin-like domain-containing protein [Catenovulum sp. SX2]|uniref:immunoglobulin-like domain-containing protein n=1 Tax=Catenovulum sp. SX2 TaxID=3398614 RepID=UPI003F84E994